MKRFAAWLFGPSVMFQAVPAAAEEATPAVATSAVATPAGTTVNVEADFERMRLLMKQIALSQRTGRYASALSLGAGGVLHLGVGLTFIATEGIGRLREPEQVFGVVQTTVGGLQLIGSVFPLLFASEGEQLRDAFEGDSAEHPGDRAAVLERGEKRLFGAAAAARTARVVGLIINAVVLTAEVTTFVVNETQDEPSRSLRFGIGGAVLATGATTFTQVFPSELERLAELWKNESTARTARLRLPRVGAAPLGGGGGFVSWSLAF
jgi:hypothetical protein